MTPIGESLTITVTTSSVQIRFQMSRNLSRLHVRTDTHSPRIETSLQALFQESAERRVERRGENVFSGRSPENFIWNRSGARTVWSFPRYSSRIGRWSESRYSSAVRPANLRTDG